jgi:hypothetical protein
LRVTKISVLIKFKNIYFLMLTGEKMFYIVHTLLGGLIGLHFHSITLIILLGIASHFLIDCIPHWDGFAIGNHKKDFRNNYTVKFTRNFLIIGAIDGLVAIYLLIFMYDKFSSTHLIIGCMASIFPDILSAGYLTKFKNKKHYKKFLHFHNNIQREAGLLFGILTQAIIALIIIEILF